MNALRYSSIDDMHTLEKRTKGVLKELPTSSTVAVAYICHYRKDEVGSGVGVFKERKTNQCLRVSHIVHSDVTVVFQRVVGRYASLCELKNGRESV